MFKGIVGRITGKRSVPAAHALPAGAGNRFYHMWWTLDPAHTHHCEDCKRLAANSPYTPPGVTKADDPNANPLNQAAGDGRTHCGAFCTCGFSYVGPHDYHPSVSGDWHHDRHRRLLAEYTHGQAWYLEWEDMADAILAEPDTRKWPRDVPELDEWPGY